MKTVTFPGFGLELELNPVLWAITDDFGVHWYGAIIAVGFLLAVFWGCRQCSRFGFTQDDVFDILIATVPSAIVGARLYYVIFEFDSYLVPGDLGATLTKIVRIWDGGLAIYGGLIAAVLAGYIVCRVKKLSFLAVADVASVGFLIGQSIGRWGNFVNVEAFGGVTDAAWRMAGPNVANYLKRTGQIDEAVFEQIVDGTLGVHPTFFYESMWNLIGILLLVFVVKKFRKFDGQMFFGYMIWYGIGRFWIEGLRTDSLYVPGTELRISQAVAIVTFAAGALFTVYYLFIKKPNEEDLFVNRVNAAKEVGEDGGENT